MSVGMSPCEALAHPFHVVVSLGDDEIALLIRATRECLIQSYL